VTNPSERKKQMMRRGTGWGCNGGGDEEGELEEAVRRTRISRRRGERERRARVVVGAAVIVAVTA
jgi:hypothetical protein